MSHADTKVTIDLDKATSAVAGDRELLAELAVVYEEDVQSYLESLESDLASENHQAAHRALHKLKGATAPFFAAPLKDQLERLTASAERGDTASVRGGFSDLVASLHGLRNALVENRLLKAPQ